MAFCTELVRKRLHWNRSGDEFILNHDDKELCRMQSSPVQVECVFGGKGVTIRRKGLLKPRVEVLTSEGMVGEIGQMQAFEPVLEMEDGSVYTVRYLNDSNTALAFFDDQKANVMEFTDISTWSTPRTELVVNRTLHDGHAKVLMPLGHYLLMLRRQVFN